MKTVAYRVMASNPEKKVWYKCVGFTNFPDRIDSELGRIVQSLQELGLNIEIWAEKQNGSQNKVEFYFNQHEHLTVYELES